MLEQLLRLNPATRLTARQALDHDYFRTEPVACAPSTLPKIEVDTHEYQVMNRIRFERMKLLDKGKAVEVVGKKRLMPAHFALASKAKEPPVHIA